MELVKIIITILMALDFATTSMTASGLDNSATQKEHSKEFEAKPIGFTASSPFHQWIVKNGESVCTPNENDRLEDLVYHRKTSETRIDVKITLSGVEQNYMLEENFLLALIFINVVLLLLLIGLIYLNIFAVLQRSQTLLDWRASRDGRRQPASDVEKAVELVAKSVNLNPAPSYSPSVGQSILQGLALTMSDDRGIPDALASEGTYW